jgi:feruloyl esterase
MEARVSSWTARRFRDGLVLLALLLSASGASAATKCADLTSLSLPNTTILQAEERTSGTFAPPQAPPSFPPWMDLPAFCRVAGYVLPTAQSNPINFEVWMPLAVWNGRYQGVGNGGFFGSIAYNDLVAALKRGYAASSTDTGHQGNTLAFGAKSQQLLEDFAASPHHTAVASKAIIGAFYGEGPRYSYFTGCSAGGKQGLWEAQRFPEDYDGYLVGDPAVSQTHLAVANTYTTQTLLKDPESYIPASKITLIADAVVAACDAQDGVRDGLIDDPRECKFNPARIQCKPGQADAECLTPKQAVALAKLYDGPRNPRTGEQLYPGYARGGEFDPGVNARDWRQIITGLNPGDSFTAMVAGIFMRELVFDDPNYDLMSFNFDSDVETVDNKAAAILNPSNPDLNRLAALGGKILHYHGWSDAVITPLDSVSYYEKVLAETTKRLGSKEKALRQVQDFYRLYMAPGMTHCAGGVGANVFGNLGNSVSQDPKQDVLSALEQWVERGIAPEEIEATKYIDNDRSKGVAFTRPLCPYPQRAVYKRSGNVNDAANFECRRKEARRASFVIAPTTSVTTSTADSVNPQSAMSDATESKGTLWVTNSSMNMVAVFDATTADVLATIPVGLRPRGIAAPARVGKIYVADEGSDTVSVISKRTMTLAATIPLPSPFGRQPDHVSASPDGRFVYVGERGANVVDVIDTSTDQVATRFSTGWPGSSTRAVVLNPDGDLLYALNAGPTASLSTLVALDARTGRWYWHLSIDGEASDVTISPDGRTGIVARHGDSRLAFIDLERHAVVNDVVLGMGTESASLRLSVDGRHLIVSGGETPMRLGVVDLARMATLQTVSPDARTTRRTLLAGLLSYVCVSGDGQTLPGVVALDAASRSVVNRYRFPGGGSPYDVVFDP